MATSPRQQAGLSPSCLVAHRGWPSRFAENSLAGYQHALAAGGSAFETDLQISDDGECWLFHDVHLDRLCRLPGTIFELGSQSGIVEVTGSHAVPQRLDPQPLARLPQLVQLMRASPETTWFWELKPESVARHGNRRCHELLADFFERVLDQVVLISFELTTLSFFRRHTSIRLGAVLREPDRQVRESFSELNLEYLFCDHHHWTPEDLLDWSGSWKRVVYTINDPTTALRYLSSGADLVETDDIGAMMGTGTKEPS